MFDKKRLNEVISLVSDEVKERLNGVIDLLLIDVKELHEWVACGGKNHGVCGETYPKIVKRLEGLKSALNSDATLATKKVA